MEFGFFRSIGRSVGDKILVVTVLTIICVLSIEIVVRLYFGTRDRTELVSMYGGELAATIHAAFKYPMSVGDSDGIKRQLSGIRERIQDVTVYICDPEESIVYSTHEDAVGAHMTDVIKDSLILATFRQAELSGVEGRATLKDRTEGKRFLFIMHPIKNQPDCHKCHDNRKDVLGSMVLRMNAERSYAQVLAARNRTILLGVFSISAMIAIIYLMLSKLIRRPLEDLADTAKRFASGDMTAKVEVRTDDEIGVLGGVFNDMVSSIASFSRKLELEVSRKSTLLVERTKLLNLLERANRELRELDKLKSNFLANMSHELRTPMNAIIGYTDLLLDGVDGPVNDEQEKSLRKVANNARHLLQLINDVLDISKIESGKIELHPRELNVKSLIEAVLPTFDPMIGRKGLSLAVELPEDLPTVYADEDKVVQVLINLISNAIKFTHTGGITVSAAPFRRDPRQSGPPSFVEICIRDTGIGIKEEDIGKLFDKFSQLDVSTARRYEGTGLGLSIARGLVVLHKGVVWAESRPGIGSSFCFTLPSRKDILDKTAQPVIETSMAGGLAAYFNKPASLFMAGPQPAAERISCWEYFRCGQTSCPAFNSSDTRCWLILGTHCKGTKVASYPEKIDFCKGCEIIERIMLSADELTEEARLSETEAGISASGPPPATVLAVDDNPESIEIIRKYLGGEYHVVGLLNSDDVVDKAVELDPAAITLDIMMPDKDGWQVLHELKNDRRTQDIPVIVLSIVDDRNLGFSLGAAEYLVKPVERELLLRKMKNIEQVKRVRSILVVDDDCETVDAVGSVLREAGYAVATACNSSGAIAAVREFTPDLIILDLTMDEAAGMDVIEYVKTEECLRDIPVIVVSEKGLSQEQTALLNGRIRATLNMGRLSADELLRELKDTIGRFATRGRVHDRQH